MDTTYLSPYQAKSESKKNILNILFYFYLGVSFILYILLYIVVVSYGVAAGGLLYSTPHIALIGNLIGILSLFSGFLWICQKIDLIYYCYLILTLFSLPIVSGIGTFVLLVVTGAFNDGYYKSTHYDTLIDIMGYLDFLFQFIITILNIFGMILAYYIHKYESDPTSYEMKEHSTNQLQNQTAHFHPQQIQFSAYPPGYPPMPYPQPGYVYSSPLPPPVPPVSSMTTQC